MTVSLQLSIPGMKCLGCVKSISQELLEQEDIISFELNLPLKQAILKTKLSLDKVISILDIAGYQACELTQSQGEPL